MRLIPILAVALALSLPLASCGKKEPDPAIAAANLAAGQAFLTKNKTEPGVVTLSQGIQYKSVTAGPPDGGTPHARDEVKVHYEGKLLDGTVFDSSFERGVPASFPLPGDEWIVWTPADYAYGDQDKGPIPANSVLEFRIQLIDYLPARPPTANG